MPSSPKHVVRRDKDFYATPYWCTRILLDKYKFFQIGNIKVVEPCAGNGAISRQIKSYYPDSELIQYEIRPEEKLALEEFGEVYISNFLNVRTVDASVTHVITNPPFSLAREFIEHSMMLYPHAKIIMLLPLGFYGSAERHDFWEKNKPSTQWVLSDRPSFIGGKTDSSVYAWVGWNAIHGFYFLKNTYKTHYERHAVRKFLDDVYVENNDMNYLNFYTTVIKDHYLNEDIYRKLL